MCSRREGVFKPCEMVVCLQLLFVFGVRPRVATEESIGSLGSRQDHRYCTCRGVPPLRVHSSTVQVVDSATLHMTASLRCYVLQHRFRTLQSVSRPKSFSQSPILTSKPQSGSSLTQIAEVLCSTFQSSSVLLVAVQSKYSCNPKCAGAVTGQGHLTVSLAAIVLVRLLGTYRHFTGHPTVHSLPTPQNHLPGVYSCHPP